jgi:hypothetical protein
MGASLAVFEFDTTAKGEIWPEKCVNFRGTGLSVVSFEDNIFTNFVLFEIFR